jgi:hypothetical protein
MMVPIQLTIIPRCDHYQKIGGWTPAVDHRASSDSHSAF